MSVAIHPLGLYDPNSPLNEGDVCWRIEEDDCLCDPPHTDCPYCRGEGVVRMKLPPTGWEMNIANGNWTTIGNAIGIIADPQDNYCGSIHPQKLLDLLESFDPSLGVRGGSDTQDEGCCRVINCGTTTEQVARYIVGLRMIAYVSLSRGVDVEWS